MKATSRLVFSRRAAALMALVALLGAAGSACGATYSILDLGTLGGDVSEATGINNSGQVVGWSLTASGEPHAFRTAPNQPINPVADDLGTLGGFGSMAFGINGSGQVVGQDIGLWRAFRTAPNQPINPATDDLAPSVDYSIAYAINDSGQVVGSASGGSFRTAPNEPINPATDYLGAGTGAYDLNNSGQVVGKFATGQDGFYHAFRTAPNEPFNPGTDDLGTLGGDYSKACCINDHGQVVGWAITASDDLHAFRTAPNQPINSATDDLGALYPLSVGGINKHGQVVGSNFSRNQGGMRPPPIVWVYNGDGPMQDLNELIDPALGWELEHAEGINDLGQIVGWGTHNGNHRAFLLTPIPEPASLVLLGGCLVGLSSLQRRRYCAP